MTEKEIFCAGFKAGVEMLVTELQKHVEMPINASTWDESDDKTAAREYAIWVIAREESNDG